MNQNRSTEKISEYRALNRIAETGGVVLFGSTAAAKLPLNELTQDYGISVAVYNRSVEGLTIDTAQNYINSCIVPMQPRAIFLHLGEVELSGGSKTLDELIESYGWLLYQLHTALPKTRLVLVTVDSSLPDAAQFNRALKELAHEYGCSCTEVPGSCVDGSYAIQFFHTLRSFFFDRNMTLSDALHCYSC